MVLKKKQMQILSSLRKNILENNYPLKFNDDYMFYNNNAHFNCYAYALGLKTYNNCFGLRWEGLNIYNPGTISSFKVVFYDEKTLIESFKADCDILGFDVMNVQEDISIMDNSFKVSIYLEENKNLFVRDFHFMRQNFDGSWSHMKSVGGSVSLVDSPMLEKYNGSYNYLSTYALRKKK